MATEVRTDAPFSDLEELKAAQPYKAWQAGEGIPSVTGFYVEDLGTVEVKPWARYGVLGSFVNLEGTGGVNDLHVLELPPGASTNPVSHMYEALVYVIARGNGMAERQLHAVKQARADTDSYIREVASDAGIVARARRIARISDVQLLLLLGIVTAAVMMARGYGARG